MTNPPSEMNTVVHSTIMSIKTNVVLTSQSILERIGVAQLEVKASPVGKLAHYTQNWEKITKDQWVLSTIRNQAYEPHPQSSIRRTV